MFEKLAPKSNELNNRAKKEGENKQENFFDTLENQDLKLKLVTQEYARDIFEANTGNVRDYFIAFESIAEVEDWIEENEQKIASKDKLETVIISQKKENFDEFLGMVALDELKTEVVQIRIWLKPDAQGKGVAKQATQLLLDWYKTNHKGKQFRYYASVSNISSVNLAKSLGFRFGSYFVDEDGQECVEYFLLD